MNLVQRRYVAVIRAAVKAGLAAEVAAATRVTPQTVERWAHSPSARSPKLLVDDIDPVAEAVGTTGQGLLGWVLKGVPFDLVATAGGVA